MRNLHASFVEVIGNSVNKSSKRNVKSKKKRKKILIGSTSFLLISRSRMNISTMWELRMSSKMKSNGVMAFSLSKKQ